MYEIQVSFDPAKRAKTLEQRGLDFADAALVFGGRIMTKQDTRRDYGEDRFQTLGLLGGRVVMVVWTLRADAHHVTSMRYCHDSEANSFHDAVG